MQEALFIKNKNNKTLEFNQNIHQQKNKVW